MPQQLREKGAGSVTRLPEAPVAAETRPKRLFTKTQVRAKLQDDVYGLTPASAGTLRDRLALRSRSSEQAPVNGGGNYNHPKVANSLSGKFRPARMA